MASHLSLRSTPFPFFLPPPHPHLHSRPLTLLPLFRASSSSSAVITPTSTSAPLPHNGPSLSRGLPVPPPPRPSTDVVDPHAFTRVFPLAALRVPAPLCSSLEHRLRGHLLNWPRIRNIARVPGDDLDTELNHLIRKNDGIDNNRMDSLVGSDGVDDERSRLSPILYREKLAREFNCRGFLKFRSLAKMSRPKKTKKKIKGESDGGEKKDRGGRNSFAVVEVIGEDEDEDDMRGLLGEGFEAGRWRGPTRLLLLDEQYAGKGVDELPEAVKAALSSDSNGASKMELVRCQITVFYDYWPLSEILESMLPDNMVIPAAFETVGHIAHLNLKEEHLPYKNLIAQVILDKNMPKIQTVVNKIDAIQNEYRTMDLEVLAGNHSLVTTLVENGIRFNVDLAKVYWNSRLATERQRLVCCFSHDDIVCDVFAGVGPIAISAAKKVKRVYANDLNPTAVDYLERNIVLNKLDRKIEVFNMDGRRFIRSIFDDQRPLSVTQVVMNLPNDALEFLDAFRGVLQRRHSCRSSLLPKIHVYGFSKSTDPEFDFQERIKMALSVSAVEVEVHRVRLVAPGKWMLCGSFVLPETVAFSKHSFQC